jgi:hypothetical protein
MHNTRLVELAISGLEAQRARIDEELAQLRGRVGTTDEANDEPAAPAGKKRRKMSPAKRKALSARMRKYWAEKRKAKG